VLTYKWEAAQRTAERALIGIGGQTGSTTETINRATQQIASPTGLSMREGQSVSLEFAKLGEIDPSKLNNLRQAIEGLALKMGVDGVQAGQKLAQLLSGDLLKSMDELSKLYGAFDPKVRQQVADFEMVGDKAAGANVILDALINKNELLIGTVDKQSAAWKALQNVLSNITFGKLEDSLKRAENELERMKNAATMNIAGAFAGAEVEIVTPAQIQKQIELVERLKKAVQDLAGAQETKPHTA